MSNSTSKSSISKLRQFRLQKKMASCRKVNISSSRLIADSENHCQSISAGKDKGVYLIPDFVESDTETEDHIDENFEDNDEKNSQFTEGPESFLQVIYTDDESTNTKSEETDSSLVPSIEIKKEVKETKRSEMSECTLPVPLDQVKQEIDFDENRTEETEQIMPVSCSDIKKELHIEIEESSNVNCDDNDDDDDNNNNDDNNNSNSNNEPVNAKRESLYYDVLKERERSLKLVMNKFPYADIMEIQDILLFSDWNVQQAIAFIQEHHSPLSYGRDSHDSDGMKNKKRKVNNSIYESEEDSDEITNDGWLARANKETLKTYSKNISDRKAGHPNKPVVFYGSKERARIKKQVENFLLKQNKPKPNEYDSEEISNKDNSLKEIHIQLENE